MIKQEFKVGDEFVSRLNGVWGYVVLPFKGYVVRLSGREGRLVPEGHLASDEEKRTFERGEKVKIVADGKKGKILDIKQFYVVQFRDGQVSVLIQEVMAKSREKIIAPIPAGLMRQGRPLIFPGTN